MLVENKPYLKTSKVILACTTWVILNILTVSAILGMGTIDTNNHKAFTDWQWQLWYIFYEPFVYPIFIFGLPLYISGIFDIIIYKIRHRKQKVGDVA